jgi:RHS repeat-associated protein
MRIEFRSIAVLAMLVGGAVPGIANHAGPCPEAAFGSFGAPATAVVITEALLTHQGARTGPRPVECLFSVDGQVRAALYPHGPGEPGPHVRVFRAGEYGLASAEQSAERILVSGGTRFSDLDRTILDRVHAAAGLREGQLGAATPHRAPEIPAPAAILRAVSYNPTTPSTRSSETRSTNRTYDALDRLTSETVPLQDGTTATLEYTYWRNGQRKTLTDARGRITFYEYDGRNRLSRLTVNQGLPDEQVTTYEYWPDSLLKTVTKPDGTVASYDYDRADRLTSVVVRKVGADLLSYTYAYGANGNRTSQVESNGGSSETTTYTYDDLDRLETVTYPDGRTVAYEYDAIGNRKTETERDPGGAVISRKVAVFDRVNRLSTVTDAVNSANNATLTYDRNGNLTSRTTATGTTTYAYDIRDQLVETRVGEQISGRFAYDAFGRRYLKIGAEGVRQYLYDQTSLLQEFTELNVEVAKYEWGADRLASFLRLNGPRVHYHFDGLGSIAALTDGTGTVTARYHYDAWGRYRDPSELEASPNRFGFTGHYFDTETNLYFAKARYYDPLFARFTTQDSFLGAIDNPPSLHRYLYANANPTVFIDPTGHFSIKDFGTGVVNVVMEPLRQVADIVVAAGARIEGIDSEDVQLNSMLGRAQQHRVNDGQGAFEAAAKGIGETAFAVGTVGIGPAAVSHAQLATAFTRGEISIDQYDAALSELAGGQTAGAVIAKIATGHSGTRASTATHIQAKGAGAVRIIEGSHGPAAVPEGPVVGILRNPSDTQVANLGRPLPRAAGGSQGSADGADVSSAVSGRLEGLARPTPEDQMLHRRVTLRGYMERAQQLDVRSARGTTTFWSGPGNRARAEAFARSAGKTTLEMTTGGRYLQTEALFKRLPGDMAIQPWARLSERFASAASGEVNLFVKGSRAESIFRTIETPVLQANPDVYRYIYRGY